MNTKELALEICDFIDQKKGSDIVTIDISEISSFADYFINCTAGNKRLLETLADDVHEMMSTKDYNLKSLEGKPASGWVLLDYGDIIVNVFAPEEREKYQIEKLWSDGIITNYGTEN